MIEQIVQLVGAFIILGAFAGLQTDRLTVSDLNYLLLNAIGSGMLLAIAVIDREWGFILLEGAWTATSCIAIVRRYVHPRADPKRA